MDQNKIFFSSLLENSSSKFIVNENLLKAAKFLKKTIENFKKINYLSTARDLMTQKIVQNPHKDGQITLANINKRSNYKWNFRDPLRSSLEVEFKEISYLTLTTSIVSEGRTSKTCVCCPRMCNCILII